MTLVFVHGWAFDHTLWGPLRAALGPVEGPIIEADLGYFGPSSIPHPTGPVVAITHSFGAQWLLGHPLPHGVALIAINGFDRFTEGEGAAGTPRRLLDRMLTRFDTEPQGVVEDFRRRCGAPTPVPGALRPGRLREDLLALRDGDQRAAASRWSGPILSLQGGSDPILPAALRGSAFSAAADPRRATASDGGHLLPLTAPDWCAAQIRGFLGPLGVVL